MKIVEENFNDDEDECESPFEVVRNDLISKESKGSNNILNSWLINTNEIETSPHKVKKFTRFGHSSRSGMFLNKQNT